jgi:hypothetical protein
LSCLHFITTVICPVDISLQQYFFLSTFYNIGNWSCLHFITLANSTFRSSTLCRFQGKSPIIEKLIGHPEYRKRDNGEIQNDLVLVRYILSGFNAFLFLISGQCYVQQLFFAMFDQFSRETNRCFFRKSMYIMFNFWHKKSIGSPNFQ